MLSLLVAAAVAGPAAAAAPTGRTGSPWGHLFQVRVSRSVATLIGNAFDPDTFAAIRVRATIDGHSAGVGVANRYDAIAAKNRPRYGPYHGYASTVAVPDGSHRLCAAALNVGPGHDVVLGCVTLTGANDPVGTLTSVTRAGSGATGGLVVTGWTLDPNVSTPIIADVLVDGRVAATPLASAPAAVPHTFAGYGNRHGFTVTVPASPAAHSVCLTGGNVGAGADAHLGCIAVASLVPSAPQGLTATATNSTITVSWAAPASDGGSAVTGYVVARSGTAAVQMISSGTTATLTGLAAATSYTVSVSAVNTAGVSAPAVIAVTTATVPTAPQKLSATSTTSTITVTWAAPASTGGMPVTGYSVTRTGAPPVQVTTPTATLTGLAAATSYTVSVSALNAAGASPAATVTIKTAPPPIPPQTTPAPVSTSHYLRNLTGVASHDAALMQAMGQNDAGYNPSGHQYLVLLAIGAQWGNGTLLSATTKFVSYSDVVTSVEAYITGYASTQKANAPLMVSIGTNNDGAVSAATGQVWATQVVNPVVAFAARYAHISVSGADDIEPGFSAGVAASRAWVSGYLSRTSAKLVFTGSADGCPWTSGTQCNNGWTIGDLHWVSGGAAPGRIVSLPQIYNTAMPLQWRAISAAGTRKLYFGGPLTEWTACQQARSCSSATNVSAWTMLFNALAANRATAQSAMPYGTDLRIN